MNSIHTERCKRVASFERGRDRLHLIVADAEVLDLAVPEVAASHDVEFASDTAGDVLCVNLRLPRVDLLEPVAPNSAKGINPFDTTTY